MKNHVVNQSDHEPSSPSESRTLHEITKQRFVRKYLHWLFIALLVIFIYWEYSKQNEHNRMAEAISGLGDEARNICVAKLDTACNDLQYIQSLIEEQVQSSRKLDKQQFESILVYFSRYKKSYDQIRYLDVQGQELLRVSLMAHGPIIVSDKNLQNKSHRPYFNKVMSLPPGTIYSSGLNLNEEYGKVEVPHKPVLRLAVPVFDANRKPCGVVVLNMLARKLREECRHIIAPGLPKESQLCLNLLGPNRTELMPPVVIKTGKVLQNSASKSMKAYDPIPTTSIPAHTGLGVAHGHRLLDGKTTDILIVELSAPPEVVQAAHRNLLMKMLVISGPLFLGLIWLFWLLAKSHAKEKLLHVQIQHDAITDPLTGLHNRRHGLELLEQTRNRMVRTGSEFSLFGIDINNLKGVNDTYGHKAGDELIISVASALREGVRSYDVVCRMGGDEFFVVLPDTDLEAGHRIITRINDQVFDQGNGKFPPYGFSFSYGGVKELRGEYGNIDSLLEAADAQMYEFKIAMKEKQSVDTT